MNNKIKVIELINRVYANFDVPKRVAYAGIEYEFEIGTQDYKHENEGHVEKWLFQEMHSLYGRWTEREVEILEDEEEIDIQGIDIIRDYRTSDDDLYNDNFGDFKSTINDLVKAVKQLDKKINKED